MNEWNRLNIWRHNWSSAVKFYHPFMNESNTTAFATGSEGLMHKWRKVTKWGASLSLALPISYYVSGQWPIYYIFGMVQITIHIINMNHLFSWAKPLHGVMCLTMTHAVNKGFIFILVRGMNAIWTRKLYWLWPSYKVCERGALWEV